MTFFYCILLSCILNLEELPKLVVRIIATAITAIILAYHNLNTSKIFNSKILSYIGDISYILYLFHWPIIQFVRYYMPMVNNDKLLTHLKFSHEGINVLCFVLSFGIAIIVHHLFEKRVLNLKMIKESIMVTTSLQIFYLTLALIIFYQNNNNYMTLVSY
jgi:peptidoglycan/LPS O-acetylase OafA/YrhL